MRTREFDSYTMGGTRMLLLKRYYTPLLRRLYSLALDKISADHRLPERASWIIQPMVFYHVHRDKATRPEHIDDMLVFMYPGRVDCRHRPMAQQPDARRVTTVLELDGYPITCRMVLYK